MGVWPLCTVVGPAVTGTQFPAWCSFLKYWMPGSMLDSEPPFARADAINGGEGGAGLGRVAVDRDLVLVDRLQQVSERRRRDLHLGRVVADRDVAAVVVVPAGVGRLGVRGDGTPRRHLVGGE